ncbi:TIGR03545 family protein, partial [bacterium]|nr:TIGR03545 family protein [bacterium]
MRKWIRWWGITVFVLIILIVLGVWYLLADRIIANNIEKAGEYIIGAKVEVGKADLTIIPLGITLNSLQVANPNSPMQNLFDVDNIRFHLDGKYLFERKIIIKDMVIDGLKFNTVREKSGEIKGGKPLTAKRAVDDFILPLLDLSKLKTFVEQEELQSIDGLNAVSRDIKRIENEWKSAIKMMPNMEDMREYRNRSNVIITDIKKNKVAGIITHSRGIKNLKEQIDRDIEEIKVNKKAMSIDIDSLKTKKNQALENVDKDFTKLRDKYTPDIRGFKNFSKYIFKDDVLRQIDEGLLWYNKLEPFFDYAYKKLKDDYYGSKPILFDGIDVQFTEYDPRPSFFIKLAKLSFKQRIGNISGEIKNFTMQQNISGLPTSIKLAGSNLDFAESISFSGSINHVNTDDIKDNISFAIQKQKIYKTEYQIIDNWGLIIDNGSVDKIFSINIHNGTIKSKLKLNFVGISFNSNYLGENNILISSIDSVLSKVSNFYVDIDISGAPGDYVTTINSNLDDIVDKAVRKIVQDEAMKVRTTITQVINDKKGELIKNIEYEIERLALEMSKVDEIHSE